MGYQVIAMKQCYHIAIYPRNILKIDNMKVLSYFISLDIDFAGKKYRGSEKVILESDSDGVELDSVNLDIHSVKVNGEETGFNLNKEAGSLRV